MVMVEGRGAQNQNIQTTSKPATGGKAVTVTGPDPDPDTTTGLEPGGGVPPGETPPGESAIAGVSSPQKPPGRSVGPIVLGVIALLVLMVLLFLVFKVAAL